MQKLKNIFKEKFSNAKKGMNTLETTIIVMILLLCILTMLDMMEINQKMSATTSAVNYVTRLVGRQGGISNKVPDGFSNYGHGAYITTESAVAILNDSLRKAYSVTDNTEIIDNKVKITFKVCYIEPDGTLKETISVPLNKDTEFGVYINGSGITGNLLVNQQELLYHRVYYIVTAEMEYEAFTIQKLITFTDSAFTQSDGYKTYTKTFNRFIIPTYYNREYEIGGYVQDDNEWFVH